jgi:regulator of replication initiation timing
MVMVRELRLENRRLRDQLAEQKLEVEDLHDDLRSFCHGLSARLKRLYQAVGQEELYMHESSLDQFSRVLG